MLQPRPSRVNRLGTQSLLNTLTPPSCQVLSRDVPPELQCKWTNTAVELGVTIGDAPPLRNGRSMSANMEQTHAAQVERLTRRIRELERGLDDVYSTISDERHPLLRGDGMATSGPSTPPALSTPSPMRHDSPVHGDGIINYQGTRYCHASCIVNCKSLGTS